jgi:hypothetical protein
MEAEGSSETLVLIYQTLQHHILEDGIHITAAKTSTFKYNLI